MDDALRSIKLPPATIQQASISDDSSAPPEEQKVIHDGIAAAEDSIEAANVNSVFTADPTTGQVNFGDGIHGSKLPETESNIEGTYRTGLGETGNTSFGDFEALLNEAKNKISTFLKGQTLDNQMQEAGEKANAAQDQATTAMWNGIVLGLKSFGDAASSLRSYAEMTKNEIAQELDASLTPHLEARYQHVSSLLHQQANQQEIETKRLENQATEDDDYAKASEAHAQRMRDAILDFLRKLDETNPRL